MDSFRNTKLIFENWKKFSILSEAAVPTVATQGDLDQAIKRIQATGWKGGHSPNDEVLLMALFKPLEGADSKPTVGALKALIKILAIEIQSEGDFLSKLKEGGVGDAWGAATSAALGPAAGSVLGVLQMGAEKLKQAKLKRTDLTGVLDKLTKMPDDEKTGPLFKALDLSDGFSNNLNLDILKQFLPELAEKLNNSSDEEAVPENFSDKNMTDLLATKELQAVPSSK
jgi:hypothetical protein